LTKNKLFNRHNRNINEQRYNEENVVVDSEEEEKSHFHLNNNNRPSKIFSISNKVAAVPLSTDPINNSFLPAPSQRETFLVSSCSEANDAHNDNEISEKINKLSAYQFTKKTINEESPSEDSIVRINTPEEQTPVEEILPTPLPNEIEVTPLNTKTFQENETATSFPSDTSTAVTYNATFDAPIEQTLRVTEQPTAFQSRTDNERTSSAYKRVELPRASRVTVVEPSMRDVKLQSSSVSIREKEQEKEKLNACCRGCWSVFFCC